MIIYIKNYLYINFNITLNKLEIILFTATQTQNF